VGRGESESGMWRSKVSMGDLLGGMEWVQVVVKIPRCGICKASSDVLLLAEGGDKIKK
jgi:hypothetical protein